VVLYGGWERGAETGKVPLGRRRRRWESNIKMDLNGNRFGLCGRIWLRTGTCGGLL